MKANRTHGGEEVFDPRGLVRSAKKRRDSSARVDAFSDAYIWVLLAIVVLVYLFSALSGIIFTLRGASGSVVSLPSAVWDLPDVAVLLLPGLLCFTFWVLLRLGPCGLSPERAAWWLPLPVSLTAVRQQTLRTALILGALLNSFIGVLWLAGLFALSDRFELQVFLYGLGFFAVSGVFLAACATMVQLGEYTKLVRRIFRVVLSIVALGLSISWSLLLTQTGWVESFYSRLNPLVFELNFWVFSSVGALAFAALAVWQAWRRIEKIAGSKLRAAGQVQSLLLGSLIQMEFSGPLSEASIKAGQTRTFGRRPLRQLPVVLQILVLRYLRGRYWQGPARLLLTLLILVLAVRSVANPLAMLAFLIALLWILTESFGRAIRPLASAPGLAQLLSMPRVRLVRPTLGVTFVGMLLALGVYSLVPFLLGMLPSTHLAFWVVGLVLAAGGASSAAWSRATRGERDWESLILGAGNEMNTASLVLKEISYLLQGAVAGLPLIYMLLVPATMVPWGIWAISLLTLYPGYLAVRRASRRTPQKLVKSR